MHDGTKLRNQYGETVDPTQPLPVDTVESQTTTSKTATLTYNGKAIAGAVSLNSGGRNSIISIEGDQIASYWGLEKNLVYSAFADGNPRQEKFWLTSVTETNGSAAVTIYDPLKDLELMFESLTTTVKRFVLKVTDKSGRSLYGWVFGVAVSSNVYTFDITNNRLTETRNWVGTLGSFDNTALEKVEIFRYNSSLTFGTGTTFTEEVECPGEYSKAWKGVLDYAINNLSNGQYFVDYMRGRVVGKKADTTVSEVVTYNIWSSEITLSTPSGVTDDTAFVPGTGVVTPAGFLADETATDSVDEGDVGIARITLDRKQINASEHVDDVALAGGAYTTVIGARADETATDSVDEGDAGYLRMTLNRRLITAGQLLDDSAFGIATDYVGPIGALLDDTGTDSVDEGDVGIVRMTADRQLRVAEGFAPGYEDNTNNVAATVNRKLAVSTYSPTQFKDLAANATLNVKASAGNVFAVKCHNINAAARFLQIHNTATTPGGGAVPLWTGLVPANTEVIFGSDFFTDEGWNFSTGIAFAFSTTEGTYTAGTATDQFTHISYK